jgi:hypothetical protein
MNLVGCQAELVEAQLHFDKLNVTNGLKKQTGILRFVIYSAYTKLTKGLKKK